MDELPSVFEHKSQMQPSNAPISRQDTITNNVNNNNKSAKVGFEYFCIYFHSSLGLKFTFDDDID